MRKRILTSGLLLMLVIFSAVPCVVSAADTTDIFASVEEGYTFQAPSAINLGTMVPSPTPYKANSTDGRLVGNNPAGYGVDASEQGGDGCMQGSVPLANPFLISNEDANYVAAYDWKDFLDTSGPTDAPISLYVSQAIAYCDTPGVYTITITFLVMPKS
jgi:hypothetical protein